MPILAITQDDAADALLARDPLALLIGMLLASTCVKAERPASQ